MLTSNAYFDQHEVVFHRAVCVSWRLERRDLSGESPVSCFSQAQWVL